MTDRQIIDLYREGSCEKAFNLIVEQYTERLYWHIRRFLCNHEDTNDLLQDVFLVNKLEVAVDIVHEGSDLLLVHIGLLYLVNGLIELLGAYLLRCGQRSVDKILSYLALNVAHLTLLACVYNAYARSLLSCTSCTS